MSVHARPADLVRLINSSYDHLTITRQAELVGVARRSYYYQSVVNEQAIARLKIELNAVDSIYTKYPFYGQRRILVELERSYGIRIGRERIRRLMARLEPV